jgi:hypothetical protein
MRKHTIISKGYLHKHNFSVALCPAKLESILTVPDVVARHGATQKNVFCVNRPLVSFIFSILYCDGLTSPPLLSQTGLPDFSWWMIPKPEKFTKRTGNEPNGHWIFQMSLKYYRWPKNISTFSNIRHSKIYPNWYFLGSKVNPSGNPDHQFDSW